MITQQYFGQCDQIARSFFQYLIIYNNENLPISLIISQSKLKNLPKTK